MSEKSGDEAPPGGAFFGRRKGKALRPGQAAALAEDYPRLAVPAEGPLPDPARLFARPVCEVHLEIGFGGGEHLLDRAGEGRDIGFIGCEPFINGLAKLIARIGEAGLDNVRLHDDDASALIARLPTASLARVYLLYPDPWPKRRQRKRRFVSDAQLAALARIIRPGGEFRFATDIDDYAGWTLARVLRSPDFVWEAETSADWTSPWPGWRSTRYETKALAAGRKGTYLTFRRR